jgi:hypothetical protein
LEAPVHDWLALFSLAYDKTAIMLELTAGQNHSPQDQETKERRQGLGPPYTLQGHTPPPPNDLKTFYEALLLKCPFAFQLYQGRDQALTSLWETFKFQMIAE